MRLLVDTHLILWAAIQPDDLPREAARLMALPNHELCFSVVSIWELVIKASGPCKNFEVDLFDLRAGMLDNGYTEIPVLASHVFAVGNLPLLHGDPFDRLLLAQAHVENLTFLTADAAIARYPGAILKV